MPHRILTCLHPHVRALYVHDCRELETITHYKHCLEYPGHPDIETQRTCDPAWMASGFCATTLYAAMAASADFCGSPLAAIPTKPAIHLVLEREKKMGIKKKGFRLFFLKLLIKVCAEALTFLSFSF